MKSATQTDVASTHRIVYRHDVSVDEIKKAIEHLSVEERLDLMQWLNQSADDEWDLHMKRDAATGKFDKLIKEADADYRDGRTTEFPLRPPTGTFTPISRVAPPCRAPIDLDE
jgi:hypothetical protein